MGTAQALSRTMAIRSKADHWDESEFRSVFFQHYERMVAVLIRLLGDRSRAEEIANDALWRLYREPSLQFEGNVGGWLYRTATNLGIDALRVSARRRQYETEAGRVQESTAREGPLEDLLRAEKCRRVRGVLAAIKPVNAQLLVLRAAGFSYKELAEALDVKASGIGTMLNRAEGEFRERYLALHPNEGGL